MNIATFVSGRLFRTAHKYARRMKKIFYAAALPVLMLALAACRSEMKKITVKDYPVARMDSTVDDYFGTRVEDPYRWMEDDNASETAAWVRAENEVTQHYLAQIPYRDKSGAVSPSCGTTPSTTFRAKWADTTSFSRTTACATRACSTASKASAASRNPSSIPIRSAIRVPSR